MFKVKPFLLGVILVFSIFGQEAHAVNDRIETGILQDNTSLVPMRVIFERLGATVAWSEKTETVHAKKNNNFIKLTIGNTKARMNGREVKLEAAPTLINGRTFVPLRFVSESLGSSASWQQDSNTVIIRSSDSKQPIYVRVSNPLQKPLTLKVMQNKVKALDEKLVELQNALRKLDKESDWWFNTSYQINAISMEKQYLQELLKSK